MKNNLLLLLILSIAITTNTVAQPGKKPDKSKTQQSSQPDISKMMEEIMKDKDMSPEDKEKMKKMMGGAMNDMMKNVGPQIAYPELTDNKQLVPKKDVARIASIPKKALGQADIGSYASGLYNKLIAKGNAKETALAKKIIAQTPDANTLGKTAVLCMMQGHPQAAMAVSMKAVMADPTNINCQNNMSALLTQYGYPEQAIPVLRKLQSEKPDNSTVLNNLAYAWLGLGETDSARFYAGRSVMVNPNHYESRVCGGLMKELEGDPIKANKEYSEAMEDSYDAFTESLLKNNNGQINLDKLNFEKLKKSIVIYEYFPKDWIKLPELSNNVSGYNNDMAIHRGYSKMLEEVKDKIQKISEASIEEMGALADAGEEQFVTTLYKETTGGYNFMSKPASIVMTILEKEINTAWNEFTTEGIQGFPEKINQEVERITKTKNGDKCTDIDRKSNQAMDYANRVIREYYGKKLETFRQLLNAYCTWSWYMVGNPRNTVLTRCINWTNSFTEIYAEAVNQLKIIQPCGKDDNDNVDSIPIPEIPNFKCPTIVSIPSGKDWQEIVQGARNFDANKLGITQGNSPMPNVSVSYGIGNMIAQPGIAPSIKTANGNISPVNFNSSKGHAGYGGKNYDGDVVPITEVIPKDHQTVKINTDRAAEMLRSKLAKEILDKMLSGDCKNVKKTKKEKPVKIKFIVERGVLTFEEDTDESGHLRERPETVHEFGFTVSKGVLEFLDENGNPIPQEQIDREAAEYARKELSTSAKEVNTKGLQPTISNGPQLPRIFNYIKGLFQ